MVDEIEMPPEMAEAIHHQYEIDRAEAGQKAPVSGFAYKGVQLESRWAILYELEAMKRIVDTMPELMARRLEMIWCDSKASATYTIFVRDGLWIPALKWAISKAVVKACGGHNGVNIEGDAPAGSDLDPDWLGDY